ncbi:MAG TPA: winged helix DNA-binding domain-containing protein [Aldersonia sp.]
MPTLTNRVLNRTLLARQHLLARTDLDLAQLCEHLVGLQAQDVRPPFVAAWNRIENFDPAVLDRALDDRSLVRITAMRGTVHLLTAADALRITPHVQTQLDMIAGRRSFFDGVTVGLDLDEARAAGASMFGDEARSGADLRALAAEKWPDRDPRGMVPALLLLVPVVQVPPRGKWLRNDRPGWAAIETWLRSPTDDGYPVEELVLRYLRAFGPASTADMQTWSRLTGLREVVDRLGDRVRSYRDEHGRTLYDVDDGALTDPETPAPVRFLGWYDNVVLSHKHRNRIIDPRLARLGEVRTNWAAVLVDGLAVACYKVTRDGTRAVVAVHPARRLTRAERSEITAEARRIAAFVEPLAEAVDVCIARVGTPIDPT